jgi:hypothetical protein
MEKDDNGSGESVRWDASGVFHRSPYFISPISSSSRTVRPWSSTQWATATDIRAPPVGCDWHAVRLRAAGQRTRRCGALNPEEPSARSGCPLRVPERNVPASPPRKESGSLS